MPVRRAGQRSAPPLNCSVIRHMPNEGQVRQSGSPRRPFFLGLFAGVLTLQAAILPVIVLIVLLTASDSVVVYNGIESPMREVRLKILGMLLGWLAFAAYFGPGLWRGSAIARRVFFALFLIASAASLGGTFVSYQGTSDLVVDTAQVGLSNVIGCAILWWYLYIKPNVREFFERKPTGIASAA
jgi:hypothetical protein